MSPQAARRCRDDHHWSRLIESRMQKAATSITTAIAVAPA